MDVRPEEWADVKYEIVEQRTFQAQRTEVMCAPRWKKLATFKKLKIKETRDTEEETGERYGRAEQVYRDQTLKGLQGQADTVLSE